VARTLDRDLEHLSQTLHQAARHEGTAVVEILQNCNVFNDGEWSAYTDKATKPMTTVRHEDGKPMLYGANKDKGVRLKRLNLEMVDVNGNTDDILTADSSD